MTNTTTEAANERLVRRLLTGVWNDRDLAVLDEVLIEDVVVTNPTFGVELHGVEQFRETLEMGLAAFEDSEVTVNRLVTDGSLVVAHYTFRGTHVGPFLGFEPSGERVEYENVSFVTCDDGRITDYWALSDGLGFMRQTGALPDPVR